MTPADEDRPELTERECAMIRRDADEETRQAAAAAVADRGRSWAAGPPLTERELIRRRDAATRREMAAERVSEVDPVTGRRIRSTWRDA